jgi:hypothetical protein
VLEGFGEGARSAGGDLVVASRRALLALSDGRRFPLRPDIAIAFEAAEHWVDRAAGEFRRIHDVEAVADGSADSAEDGECGEGEGTHEEGRLVAGWSCWWLGVPELPM